MDSPVQPWWFSAARFQYSGLHLSQRCPSTAGRHWQVPCVKRWAGYDRQLWCNGVGLAKRMSPRRFSSQQTCQNNYNHCSSDRIFIPGRKSLIQFLECARSCAREQESCFLKNVNENVVDCTHTTNVLSPQLHCDLHTMNGPTALLSDPSGLHGLTVPIARIRIRKISARYVKYTRNFSV